MVVVRCDDDESGRRLMLRTLAAETSAPGTYPFWDRNSSKHNGKS